MPKIVSAEEARIHFGQLLDEVYYQKEQFVVKKRGKVVAIISNPDDFEEFLEVQAEEADPEFRKKLKQGLKEYELGKLGTIKDLSSALKEKSSYGKKEIPT